MSGKGDTQRPASIDQATLSDRWAATFGSAPEPMRFDPKGCPHNHLYMEHYVYGSGTQRWTCSKCHQSFGWPQ
jgi:hypothetical protein